MLAEFKELFGEYQDMRVIYNPLNKKDIILKAQLFSLNFSSDKINLIAIGRLIPVKRYDLLLKACYLLKKRGCKFKLRILGDGELRNNLLDLISELELHDQVDMLGFVENPYPFLKESDIFVMSSESEGLPTVLCEAMVLGCPVVVTDCSGCREVVDNGKFGIMTNQNYNALFQGLYTMMERGDKRARYSEMSLNRASIFDDDFAVKQYEELFS